MSDRHIDYPVETVRSVVPSQLNFQAQTPRLSSKQQPAAANSSQQQQQEQRRKGKTREALACKIRHTWKAMLPLWWHASHLCPKF